MLVKAWNMGMQLKQAYLKNVHMCVCVCVCVSLSLSLSHTHTHTSGVENSGLFYSFIPGMEHRVPRG